jgi:hypothetical protein
MENPFLEVAKLIGEPINYQLPVPLEISLIADTFTAEPGEHTWRYSSIDEIADVSLDVDTNGVITVIKRQPLKDIELAFKGLNSKLDYVLVEDILNRVDTNALARRKAAIARAMDKRELKLILDAIQTPSATVTGYTNGTATPGSVYPSNYLQNAGPFAIAVASGDDLYDVILKAKHGIEDYADDYIMLAGRTVKEKIDTYDKDHVQTFRYNVTLTAKLKELGIEVYKIFGQISEDSTSTESVEVLLDANTFILVGRNSRIAEGKPIKFVRKIISADIAKQMGAEVDNLQRGIFVNPVPVQTVVSGSRQSVLAYAVYGYESIIFFIANPLAIFVANCSAILGN